MRQPFLQHHLLISLIYLFVCLFVCFCKFRTCIENTKELTHFKKPIKCRSYFSWSEKYRYRGPESTQSRTATAGTKNQRELLPCKATKPLHTYSCVSALKSSELSNSFFHHIHIKQFITGYKMTENTQKFKFVMEIRTCAGIQAWSLGLQCILGKEGIHPLKTLSE